MTVLVKVAWLVRTEVEGFWEQMKGEPEGEKAKWAVSVELKIKGVNLTSIENFM